MPGFFLALSAAGATGKIASLERLRDKLPSLSLYGAEAGDGAAGR